MIDETWRRWAREAGIDISTYPRAIDAPYDVQRAVAAHGLKTEGTKPWKAMDNYKGGGAESAPAPACSARRAKRPPPAADGMPSGLGVGTAFGGGPAAAPAQPAYDLSGHLVSGKDKSILQGVGSDLQSRFGRMIQEAPEDVREQLQILSAYRSKEHQQRLWDASDKSGKMVARPGHSQHEHGNAFDLKYASPAAREYAHANAARYGLTFPMSYEPWHIETVEARGGAPWQAALPADAAQPAGCTPPPGLRRLRPIRSPPSTPRSRRCKTSRRRRRKRSRRKRSRRKCRSSSSSSPRSRSSRPRRRPGGRRPPPR